MNSLTQSNYLASNLFPSNLEFSLSLLQAPFVSQMSHMEYGYLFQNMEQWMRSFTLKQFKRAIEKADTEFRNAPGRSKRYHVKNTRERTIVTMIGPITYLRTEYVDLLTLDPYIPIDRKLCLASRQRYDCCVEAKAKELYADSNSMIKVGKILGEMIYGCFSLNPNKKFFDIKRQTIYNLLHRVHKIDTDPLASDKTPSTLFVMADEKYVPVQGEHQENETNEEKEKKIKEMVKVAVCFEGKMREANKKGELTNRNHLVNKYTFASCKSENTNFWDDFLEKLAHKYDLSKVDNIYILGDGAQWIKNGAIALSCPGIKTSYALDRFHAAQAINRMTSDELYRELLTYYLYSNQKKDFDVLAEIARKELKTESSIDRHDQNFKYLKNNWAAFQKMIHEVHIGCAMEQAISHIIASPFTSVPKAYGKKNLPIYLDSRIHLQNGEDLLKLHLSALDKQINNEKEIHLKEEYDFSMFDKNHNVESLAIHIRNRSNKKQIFKF